MKFPAVAIADLFYLWPCPEITAPFNSGKPQTPPDQLRKQQH